MFGGVGGWGVDGMYMYMYVSEFRSQTPQVIWRFIKYVKCTFLKRQSKANEYACRLDWQLLTFDPSRSVWDHLVNTENQAATLNHQG